MDIYQIKSIALTEMKSMASHKWKETGNKYYHGQRTAELVKQLAKMVRYNKPLDNLVISAWFHDICNGQENHELLSAKRTINLLKDYCSKEELSEIYYLISLHDSRKNCNLTEDAKILQDADLLDHFGVFEVWSTFKFASQKDMSMIDVAEWMKINSHKLYEIERNELHFDISKEIYDEKKRYTFDFIDRMLIESQGRIVDFSDNGKEEGINGKSNGCSRIY